MKIRSLVIIICALTLLVYPQWGTRAQGEEAWETLAPGIEYREYTLADPNRVYVARMDRNQENATLDSGLAYGELGGGLESTSRIARRYDEALNTWGGASWGQRNRVVVAVNGSYIEKNTLLPLSGQVLSGWYAKRFDDNGGGSGFAWKLDRTPFIGGCVSHQPDKQILRVIATGETQRIEAVNILRESEGLFLYTPQWGSNTGTRDVGVEVLVELSRPAMVYPGPNVSIQGFVREIRDRQGSTNIPFDHVVLSARGAARERLLKILKPGAEIGLNQEITHFERDCKTRHAESWTTTYASVSGDYVFLEQGQIRSYDNAGSVNRHPRTAIAYNDQYVFYIVVDGRQPETSIGMTIDELAGFTQGTLEATWGIALDGGGSSTMVVNGLVKNKPAVPCTLVYLPLAGQGDPAKRRPVRPPSSSEAGPSTQCERPVVNSMMMVLVEPEVRSTAFTPGEPVLTLIEADLRLGPGSNFASLGTVPRGTTGAVVPHFNHLDGVLAKDSYWWKVSFAGSVGWFPQEALGRPVRTFSDWLIPR